MASTWGNNTWGSNQWADDVILNSVTGQQLTSNVGSTLEAFNEEGWGRLNYGVADWGEGANETISLGGLAVTSSTGSINIELAYLLEMIGSNHSLTSSVGSPNVFGELGIPLTGVSATFATPVLADTGTLVGWGRETWGDLSWGESPNQVIGLVGQEIESNVGSPTLEFVYELSSQVATTSVGSLSFLISPTISLSGQVATTDEGLLGLAFGVSTEPITGVASTSGLGTAGSPTLEFIYELSGQSATSSLGSFVEIPDVTQGLVTDQLTSTVGLLGIQSYANIDTGSNTSYTSIATGSNDTYSNVATGSNTSYTDAA